LVVALKEKEWDLISGSLMMVEMGGRVTDELVERRNDEKSTAGHDKKGLLRVECT